MSKILRQVSDKGLVVATIDKDDARQRRYALTAKGKTVMERLRESREAAIAKVWLTFDGAELRAFTTFGRSSSNGWKLTPRPRRERSESNWRHEAMGKTLYEKVFERHAVTRLCVRAVSAA